MQFLTSIYPSNNEYSDEATRAKILKEKQNEYEVYKRQWKSFTPAQIANFKKVLKLNISSI
jgi:hypothetical protein